MARIWICLSKLRSPMLPIRSLCALAALGGTTLFAQGPYMGLKAGLNASNLYNGEVTDDDSRLGFNAGFFARSTIDATLGAQVELLYSSKGNTSHYQGFFGLVDQDVDFNLNYLDMPLMAAFRVANNAIELQAGGYAAFLLSAHGSTSGDLGTGSDDLDRENFSPIDAGLVGGVAFNAGPVQIGARYEYGLVTLADSDVAKTLLGDAKNSCAQIYLAIGSQ
jgi:hypothetical protein